MFSSSARVVAAGLALVLASTALASFARADASPSDKALAAQLYTDAKGLMQKDDFVHACPKLDEALRLDNSADGVVFALGLCNEGLGKTYTAWSFFNETVYRAKKNPNPERERVAREHLALLDKKLSRVTIHLAAGAKTDGLVVKVDGVAMNAATWDTAVPIDPGKHTISAEAPNHRKWDTSVVIGAESDQKSVEIPVLEVAPTVDVKPRSENRTAGWLVLGAGGVFALGAIGSFVLTKGAQNDRKDFCSTQLTPTCPDDDSKSRIHRWETIGFVSTGLAVVGVGVGIVLLTKSGSNGSTVQVGSAYVGGAPGLQIVGTFQ